MEAHRAITDMVHPMQFDEARAKRLQTAYTNAHQAQQKTFDFDGAVLLTEYAKYLLEYLHQRGVHT